MRAWALDVQGTVLGSYRGSRGMGALTPGEYPKELQLAQAALGLASATPTIICGMAGAAQGWVQVPYAELDTPFHVLPQKALQVPDTTGPVYILPGYCQRATGRQDVMRGEESILMGASAAGDGLYCLPGTHSKWAEINGGKLAGFSTYMTGEMFDLMASKSVLRHFCEGSPVDASSPEFKQAVRQSFVAPGSVSNLLFTCRALPLVEGAKRQHQMASRLSGLLIGLELSSQDTSKPVQLAAAGGLQAAYESALGTLGFSYQTFDPEAAVTRGLFLAAQNISGSIR